MADRTDGCKVISSLEPGPGFLLATITVGTIEDGDVIHLQEPPISLPVNDILFAVSQSGSNANSTTVGGVLSTGTALNIGFTGSGAERTVATNDNRIFIVAQTI